MDIFGEKIKHIKFGIGKIISFKEQKNRDGETTGILVSINFEKEIKNLAIQNLQLNYSKQVAKYFNSKSNRIETCQLFCEVSGENAGFSAERI